MMKGEACLCVVFLLVSGSSSAPAVLWQTPCGEVFDTRINITQVTYRMSNKFGQIRNSVEQFVKDLVGDSGLDLDSEPLLDIDLPVISRGALHHHWSCKLNAEVSCVVSSGLRQFAYLLKATKDRVAEENLYGAASIAKTLEQLLEENLHVLCDVESLMAVMNPVGSEIRHCTNAIKFQSAHRFEVPSEWISSSEDHTLSLKRNIRIANEYRKFTTHVREWLRHITTMSIDGKIRHAHCFQNMEPNEAV